MVTLVSEYKTLKIELNSLRLNLRLNRLKLKVKSLKVESLKVESLKVESIKVMCEMDVRLSRPLYVATVVIEVQAFWCRPYADNFLYD